MLDNFKEVAEIAGSGGNRLAFEVPKFSPRRGEAGASVASTQLLGSSVNSSTVPGTSTVPRPPGGVFRMFERLISLFFLF